MSAVRSPVRPIPYSDSAKAFPREIMIDFSTGKFYIMTPTGTIVENPPATGKLVIKNGAGGTVGEFLASSTGSTNVIIPNSTVSVDGLMTSVQATKLNGIANNANNYTLPVAGGAIGGVKSGGDVLIAADGTISIVDNSHAHTIGNVTGLQSALDSKISSSAIGATNGVVPIGADGFIASTYLPAYIDNFDEFASFANFPTTGVAERVYVAKDTNKTYRWTGTNYIAIGSDLALGETNATAYAGDKGKLVTDGLNTHKADGVSHITGAERTAWNAKSSLGLGETSTTAYAGDKGKAVTDGLNTHKTDAVSHITGAERTTWNGKADASHNHDSAYVAKDGSGNVNITGNLLMKGAGNYGNKINFGDGDFCYIAELNDDALSIKGSTVRFLDSGNTEVVRISGGVAYYKNTPVASTVTYTSSIGTAWSGTAAPFTQSITVSGVIASDNPIIDIVPDSTYATAQGQIEAYGSIYRITTAANSITVYANAKTTVAIPIQIKCVR